MPEEKNQEPPKKEKTENCQQRQSYSVLKLPLAETQIEIIKKSMHTASNIDDLISELEEQLNKCEPYEQYDTAFNFLNDYLQEKTKSTLAYVFMYKKRPCRYGERCSAGKSCIYLHENDLMKDNSCESELDSKRVNLSNKNNAEVVFNKVKSENADEEKIKIYANKFGEVDFVRKLRSDKFVIAFKNSDSAKKLVNCSDPPMDDASTTKFFNLIEEKCNESLEELFLEQKKILYEICRSCSDKKAYLKLTSVCSKIQKSMEGKVKKSEPAVSYVKTSLYANQFK